VFDPEGVRIAEGPVCAGAENVTVTPGIGFASESVTVATSGCGKGVPTWAVCPVPLVARIAVAAPAELVRLN
jgi:hypothetical protein